MDIQDSLQRVRDKFLRLDSQLLSDRAHERTVTHRIGFYFQEEFPNWHVDCEYNRQGIGPNPKKDDKGKKRYPDVIVHKRETDENLIVIEAKAAWTSAKSKNDDRAKLRRMLNKFHYQYAFLLVYSEGPAADLIFEPIT